MAEARSSSSNRIIDANQPSALNSSFDTSHASLKRKRTDQADRAERRDLLSIHREALQSLLLLGGSHSGAPVTSSTTTTAGTCHNDKEKRLFELQRRRIALKAELEECRHSVTSSVGEELRRRKHNSEMIANRPYLHSMDRDRLFDHSTKNTTTAQRATNEAADKLLNEALAARDLGERMQAVRQGRKIAAAYRLAGISMVPCADENVLAVRLDVTVEGCYVECYHAFFDLVMNDETTNLYLRLVQHTLPPSVPLATIVQDTLGGIALVGPLQNEDAWKTEALVGKLRKCSNQLHTACYCFASRKESFRFLNTLTDQSRPYTVVGLQPTDTFSKIVFCLQLLSGMPSLQVELTYKDPMRSQPTGVTVKSTTSSSATMDVSRNQAAAIDIISDEEYGGLEDLIDTATMAFRRLPMRKAIDEVTDAMLEW